MPFLPKNCHCEMKQKFYWISDKELIIEQECFVSKAPLSDTMTQRIQYHLTENNNNLIFINNFFINFVKSTMFKSKILSSSKEENIKDFETFKKNFSSSALKTFVIKK